MKSPMPSWGRPTNTTRFGPPSASKSAVPPRSTIPGECRRQAGRPTARRAGRSSTGTNRRRKGDFTFVRAAALWWGRWRFCGSAARWPLRRPGASRWAKEREGTTWCSRRPWRAFWGVDGAWQDAQKSPVFYHFICCHSARSLGRTGAAALHQASPGRRQGRQSVRSPKSGPRVTWAVPTRPGACQGLQRASCPGRDVTPSNEDPHPADGWLRALPWKSYSRPMGASACQ